MDQLCLCSLLSYTTPEGIELAWCFYVFVVCFFMYSFSKWHIGNHYKGYGPFISRFIIILFLLRTTLILGLYFPERQKYKTTFFERDQPYKNSQASSSVAEEDNLAVEGRGFKAQLNVSPWATDCFLAFFHPMHFNLMCQIQWVTDIRSAEWALRRKKMTTKMCFTGAWKENPTMEVKVKILLVWGFTVWFRVLISSWVFLYLM